MTISAKDVMALRSQTGAAMMDCKAALTEASGDFEEAVDVLRKRGLKTAEKKASRSTSEGRVTSYIHHNQKVGVLLEVACETDFVARNEKFEELLGDLCMHIAAHQPSPESVSREELPAELLEKERQVLLDSEEVQKKPENIREKIVDGQMEKFVKERVLLEQEFVKDPDMTIEALVKETIGHLGENIKVNRFCRFELGV